jgi:hypothetical protein
VTLREEYAAAARRLGRELTADERTAVAFRCALDDAERAADERVDSEREARRGL